MGKTLKTGDTLPDITLKDQDGQLINLHDYIGKQALVIFFYPKDETPGCTAEACSFRDKFEDFKDSGAKIIGVSSDSVSSHKRFADNHDLNYTLLSDKNRLAEKAFGVPRNFLGLLPGRVTYIFNQKGHLVSSFDSSFQATRHISEALKALELVSN